MPLFDANLRALMAAIDKSRARIEFALMGPFSPPTTCSSF